MKKVILFVVCCCFVSLLWSQDVNSLIPDFGCDYHAYAIRLDTTKTPTKQYAFKITYPAWEEVTDTIFKTSDSVRVNVQESVCLWRLLDLRKSFEHLHPKYYIGVSGIELPSAYKFIHFKKDEAFKIVNVKREIRNGMIEVVDMDTLVLSADFEELTPSPSDVILFFKNKHNKTAYAVPKCGMWMNWKLVVGHSDAPRKIGEFQSALKIRGYYKGEVTNILDQATKDAFIKFQQDSRLRIGSLDFETIHALIPLDEYGRLFEQLNAWR